MSDIPKTMRAVVYRGVNDLRVETVPVPRISANELLVKVAVCGVCPTDIKKIQCGDIQPPRIFGHETAGTIVKLGARSKEQGFKVGDRVALHHHVPCLDCHFCRHRAFAQCATYKRTGITAGFEPAGGGFAEYVRVMNFVLPGVVKIPARNSFEEGAMLEPVNTVLKAVKRLSILRGDVVLVAGQGPIGLMFTRLLQLQGADVIATDLLEPRLRLAKKFGARWVFQAGSSRSPRGTPGTLRGRDDRSGRMRPCVPTQFEVGSPRRGDRTPGRDGGPRVPTLAIQRITKGRGLDAAIIAVPSDEVVRQAQGWLRGGGRILLFAHTKRAEDGRRKSDVGCRMSEDGCRMSDVGSQASALRPLSSDLRPLSSDLRPLSSGLCLLDLASVCLDEKDLLGSYSSDFTLQREVARLVFSRQLDVRRLISHRFPLEQTAAAVALAAHPGPDSLKILVTQIG
jgi:L-iditol 2-dehydrogenase